MLSKLKQFGPWLLSWLAHAVVRHPGWFFYPQILHTGLCVWYTVASPWHLKFDTKRANLVGGNKQYHQNYQRFKEEFPLPYELVVVVESENKEKNRQFVERLGARLETETNLFGDVVYKGDLKMLGSKALLFVPEDNLITMRQTLHDYEPFLQKFSQANNLSSLFSLVNRQFLSAGGGENPQTTAMIKALPALTRILQQASDSLRREGNPPSPGINALFGGGEEAESKIYITFALILAQYLRTSSTIGTPISNQGIALIKKVITVAKLSIIT